jgi:hypothetical protein
MVTHKREKALSADVLQGLNGMNKVHATRPWHSPCAESVCETELGVIADRLIGDQIIGDQLIGLLSDDYHIIFLIMLH